MFRSVLPLLLLPGCWVTGTERGEREQWWFEISAGYQSTCGVVGSGTVDCWGEIAESAPDREFTRVSAGYQHACGITDDEVQCWGSVGAEGAAILTEPSGPDFTDVSTLAYDACAIDTEKELRCWGTTTSVGSEVPSGDFTKVTVGEYFACALGEDQDLACWGQDDLGETSPPAGLFTDLDVADDHGCAIDADDDSIRCWGEAEAASLDGTYQDLAVGWNFVCGLDFDGRVECVDQGSIPLLEPPDDEAYVAIDAGLSYVCGVTDEGHGRCWGSNDPYGLDVPDNPP